MIAWNDRRKAKKAARATTRAQIAAMADKGTLRDAGSARPKQVGQLERSAVAHEARQVGWEAGGDPYARQRNYKKAAERVSKAPGNYGLTDKEPMSKTPMVPKRKGK